jgi:hypothetical protein
MISAIRPISKTTGQGTHLALADGMVRGENYGAQLEVDPLMTPSFTSIGLIKPVALTDTRKDVSIFPYVHSAYLSTLPYDE